jgi:hypothetical protein
LSKEEKKDGSGTLQMGGPTSRSGTPETAPTFDANTTEKAVPDWLKFVTESFTKLDSTAVSLSFLTSPNFENEKGPKLASKNGRKEKICQKYRARTEPKNPEKV